jgi:hypothetical protein
VPGLCLFSFINYVQRLPADVHTVEQINLGPCMSFAWAQFLKYMQFEHPKLCVTSVAFCR